MLLLSSLDTGLGIEMSSGVPWKPLHPLYINGALESIFSKSDTHPLHGCSNACTGDVIGKSV